MSTSWWKRLFGLTSDGAPTPVESPPPNETHSELQSTLINEERLTGDHSPGGVPNSAPSRKGATRSGFSVYFQGEIVNLAAAARAWSDEGLEVTRQPDSLTVSYDDGPEFRINLNTDGYVQEEAADLGQEFGHAEALSRCDRRFEVHFDDLEQVLDEMNTLIQVQGELQSLTGGYAFLAWNCELVPPDEP